MKPVYQPMKFLQALSSSVLVLGLGVLALYFLQPSISVYGNLGLYSWPLGVLLGLLFYVLAFMLTKVLLVRFSAVKSLMEMLNQLFCHFSWLQIAIISALAGLGEELLLRGVLQSILVIKLNPTLGIVIASFVFGLLHYTSRVYVLMAFTYGLMFGVIYHISHSLLLVMVIHAIYNLLAFAVLVKRPALLGLSPANTQSDCRNVI